MWNPPIALTPEEQKIAARTRKTRKFFVFLREHRHERLDVDFQETLAQSYRADPGGQAPVEAGLLALATLLQASCHVSDRGAVELTVMDKRWQLALDCLGAEQPPFSQGTLCNFRMRLIVHNLGKTLLERTVALAETTGGFGARQLRAVLDSTPLFGAGRVEETPDYGKNATVTLAPGPVVICAPRIDIVHCGIEDIVVGGLSTAMYGWRLGTGRR